MEEKSVVLVQYGRIVLLDLETEFHWSNFYGKKNLCTYTRFMLPSHVDNGVTTGTLEKYLPKGCTTCSLTKEDRGNRFLRNVGKISKRLIYLRNTLGRILLEANRFSASQEIHRILCNSKVHYSIYRARHLSLS